MRLSCKEDGSNMNVTHPAMCWRKMLYAWAAYVLLFDYFPLPT